MIVYPHVLPSQRARSCPRHQFLRLLKSRRDDRLVDVTLSRHADDAGTSRHRFAPSRGMQSNTSVNPGVVPVMRLPVPGHTD